MSDPFPFISCGASPNDGLQRQRQLRDFFTELGKGQSVRSGGFGEEGGFSHAGNGIGFEDVGVVVRIQHDIDARIDLEAESFMSGDGGGLDFDRGFEIEIGRADVL